MPTWSRVQYVHNPSQGRSHRPLNQLKERKNKNPMRNTVRAEIRRVVAALYSEKVRFEKLLKFSIFNRTQAKLLTYICAKKASRIDVPLTRSDVDEIHQEFLSCMSHAGDPDLLKKIISVQRTLAELLWGKATLRILRGKLCRKEDHYSYEATIYAVEHSKRGPATPEEKAMWKEKCADIAQAEAELEQAEDAAYHKMGSEHYLEYIKERELRALELQRRAEMRETSTFELDAVIADNELRLAHLLREDL